MKPSYLFYLFLLISFSSLAQEKVYKPFEHPDIQKLEKKSEEVIGFENRQKKSWLIAAVVVKKTKNIFLVNYIGDVINQLPLSDSVYEKILNKSIDPFEYHLGNIESALELTDAAIAKLRFPELRLHYTGIDNFEEEVNQLLSQTALKSESNTADKITLLLELRQHYLQILVQSMAVQPEGLKDDTAFVSLLKSNLAGKVIVRGGPDAATTAVFYNSDIFSPFHKAVLDIKNAKLFFYSGNENVIDSLSLNPKKSKLIFDKNLDVFALYKDFNLYRLLQADSIYSEFSSYLFTDQQKKNTIIPALLKVNEEEPAKLWYSIQQNMHIHLGKLQLYYGADIHRFEQYQKYKIRTADYIKTAIYSESSNWLMTGTRIRHYRGNKHYELTDHRGNVMAVVTDKKLPVDANDDGIIDYYAADIIKATDYAPFGMGLVDRSFSAESYRYGYNGKENDNDVKGEGNQIDFKERIYDPRLGRFLSQDPLVKKFPMLTPYQFASNTPIWAVDLDGLEGVSATNNYGEKQIYLKNISSGINSFGIPVTSSVTVTPPNAQPVTQNMSDKDLYRFVVARMLAPGQFKINPDQYLDSRYFQAEKDINYYFSHLATATMANSPQMKELTGQIHNSVVNGLFSDDATMSDAAVAMINRRTSFWGKFNWGKTAVELGAGGLLVSGFKFAIGRMSGTLESLGIPKGFGIMADPAKWRIASANLTEQIAMKEAMSGQGSAIMGAGTNKALGDPRLKGMDITKYEFTHTGRDVLGNEVKTTIHYLKNNETGALFDFKFTK